MDIIYVKPEELDDYIKKYGDKIRFILPCNSDQSGHPPLMYKLIIG